MDQFKRILMKVFPFEYELNCMVDQSRTQSMMSTRDNQDQRSMSVKKIVQHFK